MFAELLKLRFGFDAPHSISDVFLGWKKLFAQITMDVVEDTAHRKLIGHVVECRSVSTPYDIPSNKAQPCEAFPTSIREPRPAWGTQILR